MIPFEAWHLPGLQAQELDITETRFGELTGRTAALQPGQLARVLSHVGEARARVLVKLSARDIAAAIDGAAALLADRQSEEGRQARILLPMATGYSDATIKDLLSHMTRDWRFESVERLLVSELGDPAVLDRPTVLPGTSHPAFAHGPRLAFHVFSGNVPGVAVTSIIRSLLLKAATLGKTASGEPVLPVLFARALAKVAPDIAECLAATYWPGGAEHLEGVALSSADAVIVYGAADTVRAIGGRMRGGTRLVVHGPKLSFGIIGRGANAEAAMAVARATAAYDQQGCVSPHVVYVERNGTLDGRQMAAAISKALAGLAVTQPRRRLSQTEALAIRATRTSAEFRSIAGAPVELFGSEADPHTVVYDEEATFPISCLNRTLFVVPVDRAEAVAGFLHPHRELLQSVALEGFDSDRTAALTVLFADCGLSRITSFDALPWPPMWWHHDGSGPLRELLTWTDREA